MRRTKILLLLIAFLGLGAVAWTFLVDNFLSKPLMMPTTYTGKDGYIWTYVEATGKYNLTTVPAGSIADASTTVKGITKLSVAPVSATDPIAVGDPDPRNNVQPAAGTRGNIAAVNSGGTAWTSIDEGSATDQALMSLGANTPGAFRALIASDIDELITVGELSDVTITGIAANNLLVRNGSSAWVNAAQAGDVSGAVSGNTLTWTLANTAVTPASYTNTSLTVDSKGRITAASSGSGSAAIAIAKGATSVDTMMDTLILNSGQLDATSGPAGKVSLMITTGGVTSGSLGASSVIAGKINAGAIVNADVSASAAIVYSKLSLGTSIVNADIAAGAAIVYSKLAFSNNIVAGDMAADSVDVSEIVAGAPGAAGAEIANSAANVSGDWTLTPAGTNLIVASTKVLQATQYNVALPMDTVTANVSTSNPASGIIQSCVFTADALTVSDGSGYVTLTGVSVTPSKATAGSAANGRDQAGAFSDDTWVYGYVIWGAGQTTAGLWSLSPTAPTMPTNYTHKCLVAVANTGASGTGFRPFFQDASRTVSYDFGGTNYSVLSAGASTTMAIVDLNTGTTKYVPPNSRNVLVRIAITGILNDIIYVNSSKDNSNFQFRVVVQNASAAMDSFTWVLASADQKLFYKVGAGTAAAYINVGGFRW